MSGTRKQISIVDNDCDDESVKRRLSGMKNVLDDYGYGEYINSHSERRQEARGLNGVSGDLLRGCTRGLFDSRLLSSLQPRESETPSRTFLSRPAETENSLRVDFFLLPIVQNMTEENPEILSFFICTTLQISCVVSCCRHTDKLLPLSPLPPIPRAAVTLTPSDNRAHVRG